MAAPLSTVDAQQVDRMALAQLAAGEAATTLEKVRAVVGWANRSFSWTATDYQRRSVDEIIARQGGNCYEQAIVVTALLNELGIRTRSVQEINVQPRSWIRQLGATWRMRQAGAQASVFGLRHNDHFWIEFWDEEAQAWSPADPTLDLVGRDAWLRARVGFDARPTHQIVPSRDMLVPFAVFARDGSRYEPRTDAYLIAGFDAVYGGRLRELAAWTEWTAAVAAIEPHARGAFEGRTNLHKHAAEIRRVQKAYRALAAEYAALR